jgi:predicted neutral ceramidase superfamily lipid hydrolase
MSSPTVTAGPQSAPALSQTQRILNVFFAPSSTFADIRRSASWWVPFLVMAVFSIGYTFTIGKQVGFEQVFQNRLKMAPASQQERLEQVPPDRRAAVMRQQVVVTKAISYAFPIISLIFWAIIALVLWATFSFGLGKKIRFGESMAIVVYSALPSILKLVLAIVALFAGLDAESFMIDNPIGTNLGYYLNFNTTPRFLYSVATNIDLFTIWILVLSTIGFSVVAKVKRGTSGTVVFGWFLLFTFAGAGLAAALA